MARVVLDTHAMKKLLILGAGTAGTIVANRMRGELGGDWSVTVVDPSVTHLYQPGLLFLPFGAHDEAAIVRERGATIGSGVEWCHEAVVAVDPSEQTVRLASERKLDYDLLVVASGSRIRPELTEGMRGPRWHKTISDFYTLDGALALRDILANFDRGRLVINIVEMPIKCPVAPLEFAFLADAYFNQRGVRKDVDIIYATPLDGAFTRPIASARLGHLLEEKNIIVQPEFAAAGVDDGSNVLRSYDDQTIPFDRLVTIPTHSGASFIERSGLGNELAFVPTDQRTLLAKGHENIFVVGDATDVPASKAGSVAHFEADGLVKNLLRVIAGKAPENEFDGHANCFVETGHGKGMLIDFNYDLEPVPGKYPLPVIGPFSLLEESRINHLGKLAFRWVYWNALLPGKPMPMPAQMQMLGKHIESSPDGASPPAE